MRLVDWVDIYIDERKDVKRTTLETYQKAKDSLMAYFDKKTKLKDITTADAKRWRIWMLTEGNRRNKKDKTMSEETVRRRTGKVKQFFREAIERGYCEENPFAKLPSTSRGNEAKQFFVEQVVIDACIEECPCTDWRTILALCRYGGLRCPSELLELRWQDVDLPAGRMVVHAPKTEHHVSGGVRVCPIFTELRPYLEAAWDEALEGTEFVINRYRSPDQNLRTTFTKIIKQAGCTPWPRLFQNLRASRETELMSVYPAKDVASWLGNSVPVAMRHYAMATDSAFQSAAGIAPVEKETRNQPERGNRKGNKTGHIVGNLESAGIPQCYPINAKNPGETGVLRTSDQSRELVGVGDEGLEPPTPSV